MRKYISVGLGLFFAFLVLAISIVRFSRQQYEIEYKDYGDPASSQSGELVEYYLPYPGMLPDHPLYFAKMLRDRVRLIIVKEKNKKVEMLLFYADKRIGASEVLLKGNKISLAEVTAHKAEQYMGQAISLMHEFKKEERDEHIDLWWRYYRSINTHKRLLDEMTSMLEGDARVAMEKVVKNSEVYKAEIMGELGIEESILEDVEDLGGEKEEVDIFDEKAETI